MSARRFLSGWLMMLLLAAAFLLSLFLLSVDTSLVLPVAWGTAGVFLGELFYLVRSPSLVRWAAGVLVLIWALIFFGALILVIAAPSLLPEQSPILYFWLGLLVGGSTSIFTQFFRQLAGME